MTAKKIVLATVSAALIAGAAIPAFAAPGPGPRGAAMQDVIFVRLLKNADTDKDGKVSKDEMTAFQDKLFTAIDANKDGTLTRGEALDYRKARMEEFRKNNPTPEADKTADNQRPGKPDDQDRTAYQRDGHRHGRDHARWSRHDRDDRDGPRWGRHEARWERHGDRDGRPMRGGMFRMMDEDRDGKVTKAEATAASDKLFARMDTNKDNAITVDDLPDRPF